MEILKAILMGIVEGITEWLPISSTGHMILLEQLVHFNLSEEFMAMFRVVIQLGAILAVVVIYFKQLWPFARKKRGGVQLKMPIVSLWLKILVACIPAAVLGLLLDDWLDAHLYNFWVVAAMLILYGILFFIVDRDKAPKITRMSQLTYKAALIIGFWQVLAMVPGTSRSGATIVGGLLLGASRPLAAQFTFYLAIPVMFGASALKLVKYFMHGAVLGGMEIAVLVVGMVVAFIVSIVSIGFLMNYVKKHSFKAFGVYRIVLGIVVLLAGAFALI